MNYFPFHIGDYAAHTAHLEPLEDLAYRRLMDQYYLREGALPGDIAEITRLIRMRAHQVEVQAVLNEFFLLTDGLWSHARCDEEIATMRAKQKAQEEKDEHEADRMRRHRERRAAMFEALRAKGITPAWDVATKELQRLLDEACNAPATRTGALPATDLTRLSLPTPTPTPTPVEEKGANAPLSTAPPPPSDEPVSKPVRKAVPACPHQEILALFAERLPMLSQPNRDMWGGTREEHLRTRWKWLFTTRRKTGERAGQLYAETAEQGVEWFAKYFDVVADSDFLTGRRKGDDAKWTCTLEWLVNETNFAKVASGNYANKEGS